MKCAALIMVLGISACAMPAAPAPLAVPPPAPQQNIIIAPSRSERAQERALSRRDRELIEAASKALDRVRQRLDWLKGTETHTPMEPSSR